MSLYLHSVVLSFKHSTSTQIASHGSPSIPGHSYCDVNGTNERMMESHNLSRKLRQQLEELEQLTYMHGTVDVIAKYISNNSSGGGGSGSDTPHKKTQVLKILLDNAFLVTLGLQAHTGEVEYVHVDRTLFQNVARNMIGTGLLLDDFILLAPDENRLFYVPIFSQSGSTSGGGSGGEIDLSNGSSRSALCMLPANTACDMICVSENGRYICARFSQSTCLLAQVMYSGMSSNPSIGGDTYLQQMGGFVNASPNDIVHFEFSSARPNVLHMIEVREDHNDDIISSRSADGGDISVMGSRAMAASTNSSISTTTIATVFWSIYEVHSGQFLRKQHRRLELGKRGRVACCAISPSEHHVCVCFRDGSISMYAAFRLAPVPSGEDDLGGGRGDSTGNTISDFNSSSTAQDKALNQKFKHVTLNQLPGRVEPFLVKWHTHGGMLMVGLHNAWTGRHELCFFDVGLNLLRVTLRDGQTIESIHADNIMPGQSFNINNAHFLPPPSTDRDIGYDTVAISFEKGPLVLVQIQWDHMAHTDASVLPMSSRHFFQCHMRRGQFKEAYSVVRNMHQTSNAFMCLCALMERLLCDVQQSETSRALMDTIVTKYGKTFSRHSHRTAALHNLFRRYFIFVLRQGYIERAFQLAYQLDADTSMFEDIYHVSVAQGYKMMAFLAQLHTSPQFQEQLKLLKSIGKDVEKCVDDTLGEDRRKLEDHAFIDAMEKTLTQRHISRAIENEFTDDEIERLAAYLELHGRLSDALKFYKGTSNFERAAALFSALLTSSADEQSPVLSLEHRHRSSRSQRLKKAEGSNKKSGSIMNMIV